MEGIDESLHTGAHPQKAGIPSDHKIAVKSMEQWMFHSDKGFIKINLGQIGQYRRKGAAFHH